MGNVKMQKVDLCVIQDNELAQVFLKTEKKKSPASREAGERGGDYLAK